MSLIDRHIFKQFIPPFIFGLIIFTFSIITNRILMLTEMVINKGVSITSVIKLASLTLPDFMIITLPISFLLAVLVVFGKMTQDNEIMALKASGVSIWRLTKPALLFSLIPLLASILFSFYIAPRFNYFFRVMAVKEIKQAVLSALKKNTFSNKFGNYKIFIKHVNPAKSSIKGIFILYKIKNNAMVLIANKGYIVYNKKQNLISFYLKNGQIQNKYRSKKNFWLLNFKTYRINIRLKGLSFPSKNDSVHFMTISQLISKYNSSSDKNNAKNIYLIYILKKIAVPIAVILFVFIGLPLAMLSEKRSMFMAIFYTIAIVVLYYILFTSGLYFSIKTGFNPIIGVFGADIILLAASAILYIKASIK
ncbi:MAG: YjgP/YjgQ family permease [Candidatus Acididesulfobacter diazotrophicus]|uniref:YjgP/YjgQ family permease n=1 Tax=Candidatus Acididesulfobacter diazotrophicus TaxID=2597226 RepID=A0A519BP88_9DELT|nr:MAG: YjgP/YjgQ family permease [Candidatus Acididesulfobacter diazotrophicus]